MADPKQLVQSLYDAFARGDAATVLGAIAPDARWNEAENSPYADENPYVGPGPVGERVFGRILADFEGFAATPERLVAEGEDVVSIGRYTGKRAGSGKPLDAQFVHHWKVRDGKVVGFQQYTDTAQYRDLM